MTIRASHERIARRFPITLAGLGDDPVQPLCCEWCGEPTTARSWDPIRKRLVCTFCVEGEIEAQTLEPKTL